MQKLGLLIVLTISPFCLAGEAIPTDSVWGYGFQSAKDLRSLNPDSYGRPVDGISPGEVHRRFLTSDVLRLSRHFQSKSLQIDKPNSCPCWVVVGDGEEALNQAVAVLLEKTPQPAILPSDRPLTLVFASPGTSYAFRLVDINWECKRLIIRYAYTHRQNLSMSAPIALVPLGKLPTGKYKVIFKPIEIDPSELEKDPWHANRIKQPRFLPGKFELKTPPKE